MLKPSFTEIIADMASDETDIVMVELDSTEVEDDEIESEMMELQNMKESNVTCELCLKV